MTGLRVEGLFKIFGRRPRAALDRLRDGASVAEIRADGATAAVIDVSLAVEPGEIFVVMGLSGSGKSTLLRTLNGLLEPTAGRVLLGDVELTGLRGKELRRIRQERVSMVFQHFALLPHRTVLDNAGYALEVRGVDARARRQKAGEALEMVGLQAWADHRPSELSGGMQQRVGLARALASGTDVLLMDEAFSALDPLIRREMQDQLVDLQTRLGKTIVFVTHDLNEAMRLGDRVAIMRDGRMVQVGTPEAILTDPADDYVRQFLADVDRTRLFTAAEVMVAPWAVVSDGVAPHAALEAMRRNGTSSALVVDGTRRLTGVVTAEAAAAAVRADLHTLAPAVRSAPARVRPGTPLAELFSPAAGSDLPVVVVDDAERPLGVVPRTALLAALGGAPTGNAPPVESPATTPTAPPAEPALRHHARTVLESVRG